MTDENAQIAAWAWFDKGDGDLRSARILLEADPPETDAVAFHSQQAAEKYLKGFLAYQGFDPPRTHNLTALLDLVLPYDDHFDVLREAGDFLNPFAVQVRYQLIEDPPDEAEAAQALAHAETICTTIRARLHT